jgi:outer membrane biogenesis lipoprotein LolB
MTKLLIAVFLSVQVAFFMTACQKTTPEQRAARAQVEQEKAYKQDYQVLALFTKDGCTVYKFRDNGTHYFTNCTGSVVEQQYRHNNKTTTVYDEEIPTSVN